MIEVVEFYSKSADEFNRRPSMGKPAKKDNEQAKARERQKLAERENWQREFIARQNLIVQQVAKRNELRKIPKPILVFLGLGFFALMGVMALFVMSFNPATKGIVQNIIGAFKVF